jgi:hypothetical protein
MLGHMKDAVGIWQSIAARNDGEARHVLQAWHFLRQGGTQRGPDVASRVLGIVAEVAVTVGHDVLGCYRDGSARYLNFAGSLIVYEGGSPRVDTAIGSLLDVSQAVADAIGVWDGPDFRADEAQADHLMFRDRPSPGTKRSAAVPNASRSGLGVPEDVTERGLMRGWHGRRSARPMRTHRVPPSGGLSGRQRPGAGVARRCCCSGFAVFGFGSRAGLGGDAEPG